MGKHKPTPSKQHREQVVEAGRRIQQIPPREALPVRKRSALRKIACWTWETFVAVGVVLGYLSYLQPRMTVTPREALDPSRPFSVPFTIANDGYLSFRDVAFRCGIRDVRGTNGRRLSQFAAEDVDNRVGTVDPGAPATVSCNFVVGQLVAPFPVVSADITILVQYRPVLLPWARWRGFRFVTAETTDHRLVWLPQPDLPD
jgi:hypothetical protein